MGSSGMTTWIPDLRLFTHIFRMLVGVAVRPRRRASHALVMTWCSLQCTTQSHPLRATSTTLGSPLARVTGRLSGAAVRGVYPWQHGATALKIAVMDQMKWDATCLGETRTSSIPTLLTLTRTASIGSTTLTLNRTKISTLMEESLLSAVKVRLSSLAQPTMSSSSATMVHVSQWKDGATISTTALTVLMRTVALQV